MQDENATQTADNGSGSTDDPTTLSLGSNPLNQADSDSTVPADNSDTASPSIPGPIALEPEEAKSDTSPAPASASGDLESIKSSALEELMPIVSELDLEPEDKYRTLLMLIQSSDNKDLIKDAYEAAHKINDKKAKAEALLNIVNEINYFTGKDADKSEGED